jgi:outer membrane protein assembly factor BamB
MNSEIPDASVDCDSLPLAQEDIVSTYLYDNYRSGISPHAVEISNRPRVCNSFALPDINPTAVETMVAVDGKGNLFFGDHHGIFYSLTKDFVFRWSFNTRAAKVYASPTVCADGSVIFAAADNTGICLDSETGKLRWRVSLWGKLEGSTNRLRKFAAMGLNFCHYPYFYKLRFSSRCWSSPLVLGDQILWIGSITGLVSTNRRTGRVNWIRPLGFPQNYWSSPVVGSNDDVYCSGQRRDIFRFSAKDGSMYWHRRINDRGDIVGSLSFDRGSKTLFVTTFRSKDSGSITAVREDGELAWSVDLGAGFRGAAVLGTHAVFGLGANGLVFRLDKTTGRVDVKKKVGDTRQYFGYWTSPILSDNGYLIFGTVETIRSGRLMCLDEELDCVVQYPTNKILSPVRILSSGACVIGTWNGELTEMRL